MRGLGLSAPGPWLGLAAASGWVGAARLGLEDAGSSFGPLAPLPPPVSGPPLPSSAQTTEAFRRKLLLILAVIPGHPHPQLPLSPGP